MKTIKDAHATLVKLLAETRGGTTITLGPADALALRKLVEHVGAMFGNPFPPPPPPPPGVVGVVVHKDDGTEEHYEAGTGNRLR